MDLKIRMVMYWLAAIMIAFFVTSVSYRFSEENSMKMLHQNHLEKEAMDEK